MSLEQIASSTDTKQEELKDITELTQETKGKLNSVKAEVFNQELGKASEFPKEKVNNIKTFCEEYLDENDSFVVRAGADGYGITPEGSKQRIDTAKNLASQLKMKGLEVNPDLSTGNTAQAWIRAMAPLNQLPISTLNIIKDKIVFDVKTFQEKDESGTYRFAALDIKRGNTTIPNIETGKLPPEDIEIDLSEDGIEYVPEIKVPVSESEKNKFSSWEALKKPLNIPILAKIGKQYYIRYSFYEWKDDQLLTKTSSWKKSSKQIFNDRMSGKGLKANSISLDLTDSFKKYDKELSEKPVLIERLKYLNSLAESDPKFIIDQLYNNQRKGVEKYIARARENEAQSKQEYLANNQ